MSDKLHVIVSCKICKRQYDSLRETVGSRFHCLCGEVLEVPLTEDFNSRVIRCNSCGGTREKGAKSCSYCNADFTRHDRDMHTVCHACMSRISDTAKFCHHCGVAIVISGTSGQKTKKSCPSCRDNNKLFSRNFGEHGLNALECHLCAGLWLDGETFDFLEARTIELSASYSASQGKPFHHDLERQSNTDQNLYRKCPECETIMHRKNYGPGSGIVIDHCMRHGYWFDQMELGVIVRWIRTGGLLSAAKRRHKINRENDRLAKILKQLEEARKKHQGEYVDYKNRFPF